MTGRLPLALTQHLCKFVASQRLLDGVLQYYCAEQPVERCQRRLHSSNSVTHPTPHGDGLECMYEYSLCFAYIMIVGDQKEEPECCVLGAWDLRRLHR